MQKIEAIKEIIEDLLKIRKNQYDQHIDLLIEKSWAEDIMNDGRKPLFKEILHEINGTKEKDAEEIWEDFVTEFDAPLVKLNNLLEFKDRNDEVLEIEKNMARLNSKKILTVKDLEERYSISQSTQKQYRSRLYNALPYHQKVQNGKITYNVDEVERWLENQHK